MQSIISVLIFIGLGVAMYFLFRRGVGSCCGGHDEGSCACKSASSVKYTSTEDHEADYFEETADADKQA
jgi:hypothetical protein